MPDQTMIDRVARVIGEHYDGYADPVDTPANWARAMEATRAVLTAMREPTEAVLTRLEKVVEEDQGMSYQAHGRRKAIV